MSRKRKSAGQKGAPRLLEELRTAGGLRTADVANILSVSISSISEWDAGKIQPQPGNGLTLSRLHYLVGRLRDYYAPDEVRAWLYARHPQLNRERAIDLIHEDRTVEILEMIARLDDGAFV